MMKKSIIIVILVQILIALPLFANVTSVTVNPAATTGLSNGNSYYLAAKTYTFNIQATDPLAGDQAYWGTGNVILTITNGATPVTFSLPISSLALGGTTTIGSATADSSTAFITNNSPSWSNLSYQIDVTFAWNSAEFAAGSNDVTATVNETTNASSDSDTNTFSFGLCSSIRILNFVQNQDGTGTTPGVASDGRVNPWHDAFRVTGTIAYNVTGATTADAVHLRADAGAGEVINITIFTAPATTTIAENDNDESNGLRFDIPAQLFSTYALGSYNWTVQATMSTFAATETSNTLTINSDRIEIYDTGVYPGISFSGGGGINAPYYRSVNVPGTVLRIDARMENGGTAMVGATTVTVTDGTNNYNIVINNGATYGTLTMSTYPNAVQAPEGETNPVNYRVVQVSGGAYGGDNLGGGNGQDDADRILTPNDGVITDTPVDETILWDNNDPPGRNGDNSPDYDNHTPGVGESPFTTWVTSSQTASSFTLEWTPLTAAGPPYDADFYTYRIYYKESDETTWSIVDRSILGYGLGGAGDTYRLDLIGTGSVTISGLQPFTQYDYLITAVDVFGQEVEHPIPTGNLSDALYNGAPTTTGYGQITTYATTINVSITDSITTYTDTDTETDFEITGNPVAANRPLRKSAIKVSVYIITSGDQPDEVNIILAQDNGTGSSGNDLIISGPSLNPAITYERFECSKTSPNTWTTQISSEDQFFAFGSSCRFLVETVKNNVSTFSDANSETETIATANPNDFEYTFQIATEVNFTPWPTRILNNVITSKNPVAYPSYYLSDDAYVTITVHDIKGRTVATITDGALRKGGQNIKENGWRGRNKSRRKLGIGLYYIHFKAKRASDGRTILNDTKKVVIAK